MAHISREPADLLKLADIHPELAAQLDKRKSLPPEARNPDSIRILYEQLNQSYLESFGPDSALGVEIEDRTVSARDGYEIPIRTYRPASAKEPGPLIISIHGGALVMGGLTDEEAHCRLFVRTFGASCVNIDYRLAPQYKQPTQANDCWDVVKWAAAHAADLGANPSEKGFLVQGVSAGAILVDIVTRLARDERLEPPVTGQMQIATAVCDAEAIPERFRSQFLSWDQDMTGSLRKEAIQRSRIARGANPHDQWTSPMVAWPTGNAGLPRTLLLVHGREYFRDVGLIYEKILREEEGIETKLYVYPGLHHGFHIELHGGEASKAHQRDMLEGMRWLLRL
ncbi:uncharacterized protein PV09_01367 [Verruconis gallopava]|uniref:Alpha/beta hydrolase fold-3 domain-containing protein n=1 Tax=Verruconis gallopava TaxID=253628 RepID=A0A0D2BB23_9PEZI|nr:uncharacterized protein PV09_01367 [Verruconis gallopava]KIW08464.1 hypothetical protein PV09_01367 [Verruconis gallopava]